MFGKSMDLGMKRDAMGAVIFYIAHLVVLVGLSSVIVYFMGMTGMAEGAAGFFEGGEMHTLIGSLFVLWLGGMICHKRGNTNDIMSILMVAVGAYMAWTMSVMLGLVPIALLTTMGK